MNHIIQDYELGSEKARKAEPEVVVGTDTTPKEKELENVAIEKKAKANLNVYPKPERHH